MPVRDEIHSSEVSRPIVTKLSLGTTREGTYIPQPAISAYLRFISISAWRRHAGRYDSSAPPSDSAAICQISSGVKKSVR
jgi:hypothetical protein